MLDFWPRLKRQALETDKATREYVKQMLPAMLKAERQVQQSWKAIRRLWVLPQASVGGCHVTRSRARV